MGEKGKEGGKMWRLARNRHCNASVKLPAPNHLDVVDPYQIGCCQDLIKMNVLVIAALR